MSKCIDEFSVYASKSGDRTAMALAPGGRRIQVYSQWEPRRSADDFAELSKDVITQSQYIVLFGLGLGYHAESVLKRMSPHQKLVIVEADATVYRIARNDPTVNELLKDERVALFTGTDEEAFFNLIKRIFRPRVGSRIGTLRCPGSFFRLYDEVYDEFERQIRAMLNSQIINICTSVNWSEIWPKNSLDNLEASIRSPGVSALFDRFKSVPGILVSAGPSLSKNIELLREAKRKAVVAVVGTALRPVLNAGVVPDFVVTIDGGPKNYQHFKDLSYSHIPLVYEPVCHPEIVGHHRGIKFVTSIDNAVLKWLLPVMLDKGGLACGGSVANTAFDFLFKLGCDPIVLVGQDLAYTDGKTHSDGTSYETQRVSREDADTRLIEVPGIAGEPVYTSRTLYSFLKWFETTVARLKGLITVVDATEGGALIKGTGVMTLRKAIDCYLAREYPDTDELVQDAFRSYSPPDPVDIGLFIDGTIDNLRELSLLARKGVRQSERLKTLVVSGRVSSAESAKLLRSLEKVDGSLQKLKGTFGLLSNLIYPRLLPIVMQTVSRENEIPGEEENKRIVDRSIALYKGLESACTQFLPWLEEAKSNLTSTGDQS